MIDDVELAKDIGSFTYDPLSFVKYAFPWGEGSLADFKGADKWQVDVLEHIGNELKAGGEKVSAVPSVAGT